MTLQKEPKTVDVRGNKYHVTGDPKPSKGTARRYVENEMDNLNMFSIGWYAMKRCKFALSILCNLFFIYVEFHRFIG